MDDVKLYITLFVGGLMFESAEIGHKIDKQTYQEKTTILREALLDAQFELRQKAEFPVLIIVHGLDGVGSTDTMNLINEWMDPRYINNIAFPMPKDGSLMRPWMWRYWTNLPAKGHIGAYYGSYYSEALWRHIKHQESQHRLDRRLSDIMHFERMLAEDGALILKFWFHLSKQQQKKRLKKLQQNPETAWRVTKKDEDNLKYYDHIYRLGYQTLRLTNSSEIPWLVVDGENERYRNLTVANALLHGLTHYLKLYESKSAQKKKRLVDSATHEEVSKVDRKVALDTMEPIDNKVILDTLQLDQKMDKDRYKEKLFKLQCKLNRLTRDKRFAGRSLILAFEGNDAAGKGGSIRRVAHSFDASRYRIVPISAPTTEELNKPWLWRFWRNIPAKGGITIFDRTWYGRVLVERIEKLTPERDWIRAYGEINDFELQLIQNGAVIVKFWLAISNEEQLKRFKEREETGFKRYKITDEDWRNRDKWNDYRLAASEMFDRTSTNEAPWTIVEANNKYYARVKVLETVCNALEKALNADKS